MAETEEKREAVFSPCRKYRYHLSQIWDDKKPPMLWLMLNPSTADEVQNDPTVERCERRARMWGYGGSEVFNIFAYRATDPKDMRAHRDPIGPDNDEWIRKFARRSVRSIGVCGWGEHGAHLGRGKAVMKILQEESAIVHALKVNASGHPKHPLYVAYKAKPVIYSYDCLNAKT